MVRKRTLHIAPRTNLPCTLTHPDMQGAFHAPMIMGRGTHPTAASRPTPQLDFSNHLVGYGNKRRHKSMARLQGIDEHDRVFNVFVNHLVPEVTHGHPFVGRLEQPQAFCKIKVIDGSGCFFTQSNLGFQCHSNCPSLNAISWMGRRIRLGALSSTSTLRPCIAHDTLADNCAAMSAGLSTGSVKPR